MRRTKTDRAAVNSRPRAEDTAENAAFMLEAIAIEKRRDGWHETKESALTAACRDVGITYRQGLRIIRRDVKRIYADVYLRLSEEFQRMEARAEAAVALQIARNRARLEKRGRHADHFTDQESDSASDRATGGTVSHNRRSTDRSG